MTLLKIVVDGICKGTVVDPGNGAPLRYYFFEKTQEDFGRIIEDLIHIQLQLAKGEVI